jgi:hypothetical protein
MPENEDIEYRKAVAKYTASFMSNAKWLKLFRSIIQSGASVERAEWRFIDSAHSIWESFPTERDLTPTRFADGRFQPFEYRWLESVYIPSRFKPIAGVGYEREQDTAAIVSLLKNIGEFPVEQSAGGITIRAYLRQNDA